MTTKSEKERIEARRVQVLSRLAAKRADRDQRAASLAYSKYRNSGGTATLEEFSKSIYPELREQQAKAAALQRPKPAVKI